jgi:peptidyl-prolyl cis-trans isomerase SurA
VAAQLAPPRTSKTRIIMKFRPLAFALSAFLSPAVVAAQAGGGSSATAADSGKVYELDRIVAVVGKKPITLYQLTDRVNETNAARLRAGRPAFSGDTLVLMHQVLQEMIDAELLTQKAIEMKLTVPEAAINAAADDRISRARADMKTETEFRQALQQAGFASTEALRAHFVKQEREAKLQEMALDSLRRLGLMPTISVSEKDVEQAFDSLKKTLDERGPTVTFRQIILNPTPSDSANERARALADSLRTLIENGGSWDTLARKFSADSAGGDSSSARRGGDLGWIRRGLTVAAFDSTAFSIPVNTLSPVFKTEYGYHFLRVERGRPGEVRVRHILISPAVHQDDVRRAKARLDSAVAALKAGANFDSVSELYHQADIYGRKPTTAISELPEEYVEALRGLKVGEYATFELADPRFPIHKAALIELLERNDSGEYRLAEFRQRLRNGLQQAGSMRRMLDMLKKQIYVSVRLPKPSSTTISQ